MKIALMSGAYVNAGDFLIEKRCKELIENILDADVEVLKRNVSYDDRIDELNAYNAIVFGGGPGFQNIYPKRMPFVSDLEKIKVPVYILGWGWRAKSVRDKDIQKYHLDEQMLKFVKFAEANASCRDWFTQKWLCKEIPSLNAVMTGCPAWYDINKINKLSLDEKYTKQSMKDSIVVGISDPALQQNKEQLWKLVKIVEDNLPNARIRIIFHRGIDEKQKSKLELLRKTNHRLEYFDISGSADGFDLYQDCYFHIGYRVHAHIYNLSQGFVSVLLNEDARGNGVNDALGLENIDLKTKSLLPMRISSKELESKVMNYLNCIEETGYSQYKTAYERMKQYYSVMEEYIRQIIIKDILG